LGADELRRLQGSVVAVVGMGVLGGQLAFHLALLGVGMILIDCGRVEIVNLGNQGFRIDALGEMKGIARARELIQLNPDVFLRVLNSRIEDVGAGELVGVDLIAVGLDSRTSRIRVAELASLIHRPWLNAAVDGSGRWLRGTVTLYDPRRSAAPCYLCAYDRTDVEAIWRENRGAGCPSWRDPQISKSAPTLQASAFGSIVAGFQSLWAVRSLLGRDDDLAAQQLVVECDGVPRTRLLRSTRNDRCVSGHPTSPLLRRADAATLGELLEQAGKELGCEPDELSFDGCTLVKGITCVSCRDDRDLIRVAITCSEDDVRCRCSAEMVPREMSRSLSFAEAARLASRTWEDLGVPAGELVTATAGRRFVHYLVNLRPPSSHWAAKQERAIA
jgi:molybdopterin/thiamine biosynthesis adenylyltransferase